MTKTSKLIATTAIIAAMAAPAFAGNVAAPVVEPDVFVENPDTGLSSWTIAGVALGAVALFAILDDDDDDAAATTGN